MEAKPIVSKAVAEPAAALGGNLPPAPVKPEEAPASASDAVMFVRNVFPNDTVTLRDGTKVTFTRYLFETSDEKLIAKLDAEGRGHHILRR